MIRIFFPLILLFVACTGSTPGDDRIILGAEKIDQIVSQLQNKNVALLANHTSVVKDTHLLDILLNKGIPVKKILAPEHGFRGEADAGAVIRDGVDSKTGIPVVSLYGNNKKPTRAQMDGLDFVIFDIQDVGVRFYTYISTMTYMMEACAENKVKFIVLDRPNPNGDYVDGPVLDMNLKSFVGMLPVPIVHGLTIGELALMINGEGWLEGDLTCDLTVVSMDNYDHNKQYKPPVKPSPNLPNYQAIRLYPSVCLFEGTVMSLGRGTEFPFQVVGFPDPDLGDFEFTPVSLPGATKPLLMGQKCHGIDLRNADPNMGFTLKYVIEFYNKMKNKEHFFTDYFNTLAGTRLLREQIIAGMSEDSIKETWRDDLNKYKRKRKKYLLYPDFE